MYLPLTVTFLLLLGIIITSAQNSMPLELKFIIWKLEVSLAALILYASAVGGAIVAVLTLPKLVSKYLKVRSLNKELHDLKMRTVELEKRNMELEKKNVAES